MDLTDFPVRSCCFQRHAGAQCPDGLVMCCLCFERFTVEDLAEEDGTKIDVCWTCYEKDSVRAM